MAALVVKHVGISLGDMADKVSGNHTLKVGFLQGAYPDGTPIAQVAAWNEFGGTQQREAHEQTIYRRINREGDFLRGGRFVPRSQSNFATTHQVGAYTINRPPRPFFRNMIAEQAPTWGRLAATLLKQNHMDVAKTLDAMGQEIEGRLIESINTLMEPPLAPSTVRRKHGNEKPLIDTSLMVNSTDYVVAAQ